MWGYMMDGGGHWSGGMFVISHILWWMFIAIGLVGLMRWVRTSDASGNGTKKEDGALRILRERYAHGEISKEEFGERKQNLQA